MGGQLTIKAPNARVPKVGPDAPLEDRINYVLYNEINPGLAAHGGVVSLVEVLEDNHRRSRVRRWLSGLRGGGHHAEKQRGKISARADSGSAAIKDATDHTDHRTRLLPIEAIDNARRPAAAQPPCRARSAGRGVSASSRSSSSVSFQSMQASVTDTP